MHYTPETSTGFEHQSCTTSTFFRTRPISTTSLSNSLNSKVPLVQSTPISLSHHLNVLSLISLSSAGWRWWYRGIRLSACCDVCLLWIKVPHFYPHKLIGEGRRTVCGVRRSGAGIGLLDSSSYWWMCAISSSSAVCPGQVNSLSECSAFIIRSLIEISLRVDCHRAKQIPTFTLTSSI